MSALDLLLIGLVIIAVAGGFRIGFLARVASWLGLVVGFYLAVRLTPTVLRRFDPEEAPVRLLIVAAVLVTGAFLGQALGLLGGGQLRRFLPFGGLRTADRVAGGFAGGLSVFLTLWLLLPMLADVRGSLALQVRSSKIAQTIADVAPPPPNAFQTLRRLVRDTGFPEVFADLRPSIDAGQPPVDAGLAPGVQERVLASVVKIEGVACDRLQEGSGFVAGDGVVVTNAHVVAGENSTRVVRPNGRDAEARVVVFDPNRDLAILAVPGLGLPALPRSSGEEGERGAVFGHPGGQDQVRVAPALISEEVRARGLDLYGKRETQRDVYILAAALAPGDSGAALVDRAGSVIGVAFAVAPDRQGTSYALAENELEAALQAYNANPRAEADTGPCISN